MELNSQIQVNNALFDADDFRKIETILNETTPDVTRTGKKVFNFTKDGQIFATLAFNEIIQRGEGIESLSSAKDRKTGKEVETKLKKWNEELDQKIKNSSFLTRCFAFLRHFFSKLNPFSCVQNFQKNGFSRLNYYTEREWRNESYSPIPEIPAKVSKKFLSSPVAYYSETQKKATTMGNKIIHLLSYLFAPSLLLFGSVIITTGLALKNLSLQKNIDKFCPIVKKNLASCLKHHPVKPFGHSPFDLFDVTSWSKSYKSGPCDLYKRVPEICG